MALKVFITGASSGIGAALAAHYAREGATLGLLARRLEEINRVRQQMVENGIEVSLVRIKDAPVRN